MEHYEKLNDALVYNQNALRAEVEAWAREQYNVLNIACARADFERAVLEAVRNESDWQLNTNSDLCSALGHCTLLGRIEELVA